MANTRQIYLDTAGATLELISDRAVASVWDEPSVLDRLSVGDLAAHLARSILQVEWYLDAEVPDVELVDAASYYAVLEGFDDLDSPLNVGVRARAAEVAEQGHGALVDTVTETLDRLRTRISSEPDDRCVEAFGRVLLLDEYLKTRLVEMAVHIDDLVLSVGLDIDPPDDAVEVAIETLVGAAAERHGSLAVLRALTRSERDAVRALRVL